MGRKVNKTGCMTQKFPKYKPLFAIPSASMIIRTGYFVSKRYCSNFRIITATLRWPIFSGFFTVIRPTKHCEVTHPRFYLLKI